MDKEFQRILEDFEPLNQQQKEVRERIIKLRTEVLEMEKELQAYQWDDNIKHFRD